MKNYKVYGGNRTYKSKQKRIIVAAKSQKEAAALFGVSYYIFKTWYCETGNDLELSVALSNPGTVFVSIEGMSENVKSFRTEEEELKEWRNE